MTRVIPTVILCFRTWWRRSAVAWAAWCCLPCLALAQTGVLYQNDFAEAELGKVPEAIQVLDGGFVVGAAGDNRFLELPGAPLETYGALFGPAVKEDVSVCARIYGTSRGRRSPTFAVGLNGAGGLRLQVSPGKKELELYRGEARLASAPFDWREGQWTWLRLQVRRAGPDLWKLEGRAWAQGSPEPEQWTIAIDEKEEPRPGRAAIWGSPFAGTPIRFDDLSVTALPAK